jgi:hypothetical protein
MSTSLCAIGMPVRGPARPPARAASAAFASSRARSASIVMNAFSAVVGFDAASSVRQFEARNSLRAAIATAKVESIIMRVVGADGARRPSTRFGPRFVTDLGTMGRLSRRAPR